MIPKALCIIVRFDAESKQNGHLSEVFTRLLGGVYLSGFT